MGLQFPGKRIFVIVLIHFGGALGHTKIDDVKPVLSVGDVKPVDPSVVISHVHDDAHIHGEGDVHPHNHDDAHSHELDDLHLHDIVDVEHKEGVGRFILTNVGTMMCYKGWEANSSIDFHLCNTCFNNTLHSETELSEEEHVNQVETCFFQYLNNTEFQECYPMLRNASLHNKPHDILVGEPPFEFPYRNFARCVHGIMFKREALKCATENEVIQGVDALLEKFACLLTNIMIESNRFSEHNIDELLASVPYNQQNGTQALTNSSVNGTQIHELNISPVNGTQAPISSPVNGTTSI